MSKRASIVRRTLVTGALVTGVGLGAAGIAAAATGTSSSGSSGTSSAGASGSSTHPAAPSGGYGWPGGAPADPAAMTHGPGETLLSGTNQQKADAAATAAVPGATVIRAETDSSGAATYEVHMKKADGTYVTVQLDANFKEVRTISGFGPGPAGGQPANGHDPSGATPPPGPAAPSSAAA